MVAEFSREGQYRAVGPQLLRSWLGYRRRVEERLAAAGFADRRLPNGVILRLCATDDEMTVSRIGRELDISRQGASKQVGELVVEGYLVLEQSPDDGREKFVRPTPAALVFLRSFDQARREVDEEIRARLGDEALDALSALFDLLADPDDGRVNVWREARARAALLGLDQQ
ncbi:MarR family winged helix-turn-helix transcriptional regulator [Streptomyces sp. SP17BM10]|uniref:MarR family winged helix-turn-helix transcriptional regulator n=1 Tax=Streptomyces sp. SP17BM10 TaxID=3002530 RepID=UPI002E787377|nr:MarR family winged helix-turn-helix transcriptional regulator [Streptomyces sp. SP17BM10]MEE1782147.1 MarR family winged helix-turn-helix transcriptional regulator [Streptomyces sp. SP17BM10]